jgi:hypothetical protein
MTLSWTNADIDFDRIDPEIACADEPLLSLVAAASLVEAASDLYTANLVRYFKDDTEVGRWLATQWEPEELQHGRALRGYIARVWPAFDWERTFQAFLKDYSALCQIEALRPTPALEMVARCVVETGTATLYGAIHKNSREPVLRQIASRIRQDEIRHFKHFYRYFRKYQRGEKLGRLRVARALLGRVAEVRRDDASCAFRHVFLGRYPQFAHDRARAESWSRAVYSVAKRQYPFTMAAKMLLTPLELHPKIKPWLGLPVAFAARLVMWGL